MYNYKLQLSISLILLIFFCFDSSLAEDADSEEIESIDSIKEKILKRLDLPDDLQGIGSSDEAMEDIIGFLFNSLNGLCIYHKSYKLDFDYEIEDGTPDPRTEMYGVEGAFGITDTLDLFIDYSIAVDTFQGINPARNFAMDVKTKGSEIGFGFRFKDDFEGCGFDGGYINGREFGPEFCLRVARHETERDRQWTAQGIENIQLHYMDYNEIQSKLGLYYVFSINESVHNSNNESVEISSTKEDDLLSRLTKPKNSIEIIPEIGAKLRYIEGEYEYRNFVEGEGWEISPDDHEHYSISPYLGLSVQLPHHLVINGELNLGEFTGDKVNRYAFISFGVKF